MNMGKAGGCAWLLCRVQRQHVALRAVQFASLDERLAEVEAVRERNQRAEAEAASRVRRLAEERASNIASSRRGL